MGGEELPTLQQPNGSGTCRKVKQKMNVNNCIIKPCKHMLQQGIMKYSNMFSFSTEKKASIEVMHVCMPGSEVTKDICIKKKQAMRNNVAFRKPNWHRHAFTYVYDFLNCIHIIYICISNPKQKKSAALRKAMVKKDVKFKVAAKKWL